MASGEQEDVTSQTGMRNQGSGGRSPNPAYELFVLGELMAAPQYGYKLHAIVHRILGPFHRVGWGTLYPLVRRLEQQGLITSEIEKQQTDPNRGERGQQRRIYQITEVGRARFFNLMLEPGEYSQDYADLFVIKLTKFNFLTPAQRLAVLQQYREYLSILRDHYYTGQSRVTSHPGITEQERPFILQTGDYRVYTLDAELTWVDSRIASLTKDKEINDK